MLPARSDWQHAETTAAHLLPDIAAICAACTPSAHEAQTERDLARPLLERLGHTCDVQPALRVPGQDQAARLASSLSAHVWTEPLSVTVRPCLRDVAHRSPRH